MTDGLSAADVMALTSGDKNSEWMNNPFIYLVWLALLGNGGIFGGGGNNAATQGMVTRAELYDGFNNNQIDNGIRGLSSGLCEGFYAMNNGMMQGFNGISRELCDNRFASQQCCCETNRNIDNVRFDAAKNTCDITSAIHAEGEATRALINANTMQELRDRLENRDRELMTANFQISQQAQSANLINTLRPVPQPAYITCSPYVTYGCNGFSGCCCNV